MKAIFTFLFFFAFLLSFAQDSDDYLVSPKGDTVQITAIPLLEINDRVEKVNNRLGQFPEVAKARKEISQLDSLFVFATELLDKEEARFNETDYLLTLRNVDDFKKQWEGYETALNKWKSALSDRISELQTGYFEAQSIKKAWQKTEVAAREEQTIKESIEKISDVINKAGQVEKALKGRQDTVLLYQSRITDLQLRVSDVLGLLNKKKSELQSEYFIQDSPPLWHASDSTWSAQRVKSQLKSAFKENYRQVDIFLKSHENKKFIHIIIFIVLFGLFFILKRTFKIPEGHEGDLIIIRTRVVLNLFPASALLLTLSISFLLYSNIPTSVRELNQVLLLIPALILLPKLVNKSLYPLIFSLIILFVIDEFQFFFIGKTFFSRIMMLFEEAFLFWLILKFTQRSSPTFQQISPKVRPTIKNFKPIYLGLIILSFLANIGGFLNLATITNNLIIGSIMVAIFLLLLVIVLDSLFYCLFSTRFFEYSNIIKFRKDNLLKNIHKAIKFIVIFLWIHSILSSLSVADQFYAWLNGIFSYTWEFGSVSISFGGILAFFIVLLVTTVVTKVVRVILEEEVFPRVKLARGIPGAISMVISYTLVAFGIYIAISAAGFNLDKFNLLAGALGVGIGFGLQGVVYNFISGLILAFERPIQKGDTIEIGTLMGDVTRIGVRASTVRTYDGSEVIVPNGNLISNEVVNWTLSDRKRRSVIPVSVAYGSKPREVLEIIAKVAGDHPEVLDFPKPWPLFDGFGDSSLNFRILFWVDFDRRLSVTSEIAINIYDALEEANIQIPFPQQDLHIKSFDPTVQEIVFPGKGDPGKK